MRFNSMIGDARIKVHGSLGFMSGDELYGKIQISESMDPTSAITIDWDGFDSGDTWEHGDDGSAKVIVGSGEDERTYVWNYHPHCDCVGANCGRCDRVWLVTECKGDMNNDGSINSFDVNGFIAALVSVEDYAELYPGLEGSMVYHGDANCDGTLNNFDINDFLARVADGCCICGGCSFFMGGGGNNVTQGGGGEGDPPPAGGMSAEEAADLLATYVDPAFMSGLMTSIADLAQHVTQSAAAYWNDVLAYLE